MYSVSLFLQLLSIFQPMICVGYFMTTMYVANVLLQTCMLLQGVDLGGVAPPQEGMTQYRKKWPVQETLWSAVDKTYAVFPVCYINLH